MFGKEVRWVLIIAGTLIGILVSVFGIGWSARGQTARIQAVEVETARIGVNFKEHCITQTIQDEKLDDTLDALRESVTTQTILLGTVKDKLDKIPWEM